MPERMSDRMSEYMLERISDRMLEVRMDMQQIVPDFHVIWQKRCRSNS